MTQWVGTEPAAVLDVRLLPWRPRLRVMKPETLREGALDANPLHALSDGLRGLAVAVVLIVVVLVAAGKERCESFRLIWNAVRHVRAINHDRRVRVRWAWA